MMVLELRLLVEQMLTSEQLIIVELMLLPFVELHIVRLAFVTFVASVAFIAFATSVTFT